MIRQSREMSIWGKPENIDEQKTKYIPRLDEDGSKRVLLIVAAILAARKRAQQSPGRVPATICAISDAIQFANQVMTETDRLWSSSQATNGAPGR